MTRRFNAVVRIVAADLGNTPAVSRSSYVHPSVVEAYRAGALPPSRLEAPAASDPRLRETEQLVIDLLAGDP